MQAAFLVIAVFFGRYAYTRSGRFERRYGKGPWGGSPLMWGIIGFLFGLIGLVFLSIAERNTRKQVQANAQWATPQYGAPPAYRAPVAPPVGQWSPALPPAPAWGPPPAPGTAPATPGAPNVGGTDFLPRQN